MYVNFGAAPHKAILTPKSAQGQHSGREFLSLMTVLASNIQCRGQILGWTGLIRVDNTSYTWMGAPSPSPTLVTQTSFEYTSTRSTFVMDVAGVVEMNITFLSPITPTDLMRQSLVFSYVDVSVTSTDGAAHDVQLYTDLTAGNSFNSVSLVLFLLIMLLDRVGLWR